MQTNLCETPLFWWYFQRISERYISVFQLASFPLNEFKRNWSISCIFCLKRFSPLTSLLSVSKDWWTLSILKRLDFSLKRVKEGQFYSCQDQTELKIWKITQKCPTVVHIVTFPWHMPYSLGTHGEPLI